MLSSKGRGPVAPIVEPIARGANAVGLTPNAMTVIGTIAAVTASVVLIPMGHLFAAALLAGVFTAFDMIDGTMARLRGGGTKFGAVLDASCDRITDGALFAAIFWWLAYSYDASAPLLVACLTVLIGSQTISYVKARAEASGFTVSGGLIERPERLILGLVGIGLQGLGVPYAIDVAIWLLAVGTVFTVVQRVLIVAKQPGAQDTIAPPEGA